MSRKQHWESVYQNKSVDSVSWYQDHPTVSLELIKQSGIEQDAEIIDVGAGASMLEDYLLTQSYTNITVLDISATAIEHARARLGANAGRVNWVVSDITTFESPRRFRFWHDRAVFHFLTDADDRARYLQKLNQYLEPGGFFLLATFGIGGPEKCSGLDVVQYDRASIQAFLGERFHLLQEQSEEHITPAGKPQNFNFFLFRLLPS